MENLNNAESYHGFYLSDVVRSSLWWDEVWKPHKKTDENAQTNTYEPDPDTFNPKKVNDTAYLQDYGNVPGTFRLPVCRSWYGEAISDINSKDRANAPCLCNSVDPAQKSFRNNPNNYTLAHTRTAVKEGGWYNFNGYGKLCLKHHDCEKEGSWKTMLNLTGEEKPAKRMKPAWTACQSKDHGVHKLRPPQMSDPRPTNSTADPSALESTPQDPPMAASPTRQPLVQATHEFVTNVTRSPKKRSDGETCEGPQCIVVSVYRIVEHAHGRLRVLRGRPMVC
jgi:hypothetical protein